MTIYPIAYQLGISSRNFSLEVSIHVRIPIHIELFPATSSSVGVNYGNSFVKHHFTPHNYMNGCWYILQSRFFQVASLSLQARNVLFNINTFIICFKFLKSLYHLHIWVWRFFDESNDVNCFVQESLNNEIISYEI